MKTSQKYRILFLALTTLVNLSLRAQSAFRERLEQIEKIHSVKQCPTTEFKEKCEVNFIQPLDHDNPEKGTFTQRIIVAHVGFDRPTVLVTEGYGATYALASNYREEISRLINANMIFVEHRYFLKSTPEPCDWKYLTAEQSADDLHAITKAFKNLYPGKWIATGISKGGQTSMIYRTFYPNDVDITVPYVAPLCYGVEDGRHEPFLQKVGTAEERNTIETYQREVLKRRDAMIPMLEKYSRNKGYHYNVPLDEILDYCVLEYSFALWQWGTPTSTIPPSHATDSILFAHLMAISSPSYFAQDNGNESFFVQAARELGYYGYDITPFREELSISSAKGYLDKMMVPEDAVGSKFSRKLSRRITRFLKRSDACMLFIYGEIDPWSAAAVTWLDTTRSKNKHIFVEPRGSHKARIGTLPKDLRTEVLQLLMQWLKE